MLKNLQDAIAEINEGKALNIIQERLKAGENPSNLLDTVRSGARKAIGFYESGRYGRIELQMIHLIVDQCLNLLGSRAAQKQPSVGRILTGTLPTERDEMGRDVTPMILFSGGFDIIDLGSQVPPQEFAKKANEVNPDLVAITGVDLDSLEDAAQAVLGITQLHRTPKIMVGPLIKCGHELKIDADLVKTLKANAGWNDAPESVNVAKSLLERKVEVVRA
ncbi:MAG: hypothetical protein HYY67_05325 [Thaumarchaeota archaeon]|nr:hypothetical protein [Nitrososphaerota archaeon]